VLAGCISTGHKILIFGNGGSAADSQHIAAEFVNRFRIERPPLAALALTTDTSVLTSIGNDYHFDEVFEKQIHALGIKGDVAWGISTSGNSPNVVKALQSARTRGLGTIGMTGRGACWPNAPIWSSPSSLPSPPGLKHTLMGHLLCELVDGSFRGVPAMKPDIEPIDLKGQNLFGRRSPQQGDGGGVAAAWTWGASFAAFLERLPNAWRPPTCAVIAAIVNASGNSDR
jgi:D-sedoheptulose 7-phosphate isomerase